MNTTDLLTGEWFMRLLTYPLLLLHRKHGWLVDKAVHVKTPYRGCCVKSQVYGCTTVWEAQLNVTHIYLRLNSFTGGLYDTLTLIYWSVTGYNSEELMLLLYSLLPVTLWGLVWLVHKNRGVKVKIRRRKKVVEVEIVTGCINRWSK